MPIPAVGNVLTPPGFQLQSCENLVQLFWDPTPLATLFYISRSTNGVTYMELGTTTALSYEDTTGVVNTIYYYRVQAGDGTSSSLPTSALQGLSLNPGQTTVGNIRLQAQQRCNFENQPFVTNQEWASYINASYKELYDILIQKFGNDYFMATPYKYTTDGTLNLYPLPADFYKLMLVEVQLNGGDPNSWVTLKKFMFIQKNLWNYPNVYTMYGITNLRYRLTGNNLNLVPLPSGNQTIRIWYSPRPNQLINDTDTLDCVSGWEEYIIADICIKALAKEESDASVFIGQKQALLKRIEEAAENRDVGEPETVSDSKMRNFAWSDDGMFGGNSGGGA